MEKVLVTGATGYIGLHCVQQLLSMLFGDAVTTADHNSQRHLIPAPYNREGHLLTEQCRESMIHCCIQSRLILTGFAVGINHRQSC